MLLKEMPGIHFMQPSGSGWVSYQRDFKWNGF
jgi:hypothetical protein